MYNDVFNIVNCLHMVIWFQVFISNTNNFQIDLFDVNSKQVLPLPVRVDLGVMAVEKYCTFL